MWLSREVPEVDDRRVAVADVRRPVRPDALREHRRRAHHKVVVGEVEAAERAVVEREEPTGPVGAERQALEEGRAHLPEAGASGQLRVEGARVEVGAGPDLQHLARDSLGATQLNELVVDDRYPHPGHIMARTAVARSSSPRALNKSRHEQDESRRPTVSVVVPFLGDRAEAEAVVGAVSASRAARRATRC